jgi:hypothetical protein
VGKATAIPEFDYDLVAFVNDEEPVFDDVLDCFETTLILYSLSI